MWDLLLTSLRDTFRAIQIRAPRPSAVWKLGAFLLALPFLLILTLVFFCGHGMRARLNLKAEALAGFRMRVRSMDAVDITVHQFGVWEPDITGWLLHTLRPGDLFVDVGAHVGYHTLLAAECVGERGRVIAIEASPHNLERLKDNLALNGNPPQVEVVHAAASDAEGRLQVTVEEGFNTGWATTRNGMADRQTIEVPALPLDTLLKPGDMKKVKVVKVDVEGDEARVIAGMTQLLDRVSPEAEFLIELSPRWWVEPKPEIDTVLQPFFERGYLAYRLPNDYWPWRSLWPRAVSGPQPIEGVYPLHFGQIDLVLSRKTARKVAFSLKAWDRVRSAAYPLPEQPGA